jgi:glutathione S-transferase
MPLGAIPVLEMKDIRYCQSMALVQYAAKQAGHYPEDPSEALVVDEFMDACCEIQVKVAPLLLQKLQAQSDDYDETERERFGKA